jgi:diaminohydroxyphosphoribosylaminopyrimidine deaminase/5-amino-6-(5-phosphoribosylamino)uracil reductase
MPERFADPRAVMRRALDLAARGLGFVEPNPPVGAVLVDDDLALVAEGYHQQYGLPHAEIDALHAAGVNAAGKTLYVTLEPCCHQGKTGPCTRAIIDAGIRKVVAAMQDPFHEVSGRGFEALRNAGVDVKVGLMEAEAARLIAPFVRLVTGGRPWVLAKWAMTLDGKIASRTGSSKWISGERAREIVHRLRGRMDAIIVGAGTARHDDPLLIARPAGPHTATRIVIDTHATLSHNSQLVRTVEQAPVLVAVGAGASAAQQTRLRDRGVEVLTMPTTQAADTSQVDVRALLQELGRRRMTNVLVEGGGRLLGNLFDLRLIDEAHAFVSPRLIGGAAATTPIGGIGLEQMSGAANLDAPEIEIAGEDVYFHGLVNYSENAHGTERMH